MSTNKKAKIKGCGEVWFNQDFMTNVLSLKNVKKFHHVTCDSAKGGSFVIHCSGKSNMHFRMHDNGLHCFNANKQQVSFVETVEEGQKATLSAS